MEWRLTATTLFCEEIRKWVPVMVYREGKTGCGFFKRQGGHKNNGRMSPCSGPQDCFLCASYREDVFRRNGHRIEEKERLDEEKTPA